MKIDVISFGHSGSHWVKKGLAEYQKRIPNHTLSLHLTALTPSKHRQATSALAVEAKMLQSYLEKKRTYNIALDLTGQKLSSLAFANALMRSAEKGCFIQIFIGSAFGLCPKIKNSMDALWSISDMTLPHQLVRLILFEQIYRAWTIYQRHPYHTF